MTAVESLRQRLPFLLGFNYLTSVGKELTDTCLVLADAYEEEGDSRGAEFWRRVGSMRLWPTSYRENPRRFEWWCRRGSETATDTPGFWHLVNLKVFRRLGPVSCYHGDRAVKFYRSLPKAIFSLESAWRAVDSGEASE